jgi:hypothetical protein
MQPGLPKQYSALRMSGGSDSGACAMPLGNGRNRIPLGRHYALASARDWACLSVRRADFEADLAFAASGWTGRPRSPCERPMRQDGGSIAVSAQVRDHAGGSRRGLLCLCNLGHLWWSCLRSSWWWCVLSCAYQALRHRGHQSAGGFDDRQLAFASAASTQRYQAGGSALASAACDAAACACWSAW